MKVILSIAWIIAVLLLGYSFDSEIFVQALSPPESFGVSDYFWWLLLYIFIFGPLVYSVIRR